MWIVVVNLLSIAAFLHARGVSSLVGARLAPDTGQLALKHRDQQPAERSSVAPRGLSAAAILARNAFDSLTGPIHEGPATPVSQPESTASTADVSDPMDAPRCEGVRVIAIAASSDRDWSLASFTSGAASPPLMRRRGGELAGKTVTFIGTDRAWLFDGKKLCQVLMSQPSPKAVTGLGAGPGAANPKRVTELSRGIHPVSPTSFNIERNVVEEIRDHMGELLAGAQAVPDAEGRGFRVSGIKPGGALALLGIQNGDRLETINGFDLSNPEKALEAYARLNLASHLTVTVRRGGEQTNLDYDVQE